MTPDEEAAAKAKEKADKDAKEKADKDAADALASAARASEEAHKKEKQFWTDAHNELKTRVGIIEDKTPSKSWTVLAVLALIFGGFSAVVILLVFVASLARRVPPKG